LDVFVAVLRTNIADEAHHGVQQSEGNL